MNKSGNVLLSKVKSSGRPESTDEDLARDDPRGDDEIFSRHATVKFDGTGTIDKQHTLAGRKTL